MQVGVPDQAHLRAATCVVGTAMMRLEQAALMRRSTLPVLASTTICMRFPLGRSASSNSTAVRSDCASASSGHLHHRAEPFKCDPVPEQAAQTACSRRNSCRLGSLSRGLSMQGRPTARAGSCDRMRPGSQAREGSAKAVGTAEAVALLLSKEERKGEACGIAGGAGGF